jgi:hypothetical protein
MQLGLDKDAGLRDVLEHAGAVGKQLFHEVLPSKAVKARRAAAKALAEAPLPAREAERIEAIMTHQRTGRLPPDWGWAPEGLTPVHISERVAPSWMKTPPTASQVPAALKAAAARWPKIAAVPVSTGNTSELAVPPLAPESPTLKKPKPPKPGNVNLDVIPPPDPLKKTARAHKLSRRMEFRGLKISVETDKGEKRHWKDPNNGETGFTLMKYPYGYIRMTKGVDGDHVDVYVGPNEQATKVYVVHQQKAPNFDKYDEDKCMLGFDSADAAKKAYLDHYNNDRFFGSMTVMPFEQFKKKVLGTFKKPQKIAETVYKLGAESAWERLGLKKEKSTLEKVLPWAAGLGSAALTYGALRRFRPAAAGNPLRALQMAAKDKGFTIATEPASKATQRLRSLIFGAPTVSKGKDVGGVVLHHTPSPARGMGEVNIGEGGLTSAMHDKYMFDRIMREGVGAGPGLKGALPDTELLRDALQRARGNPEALKAMFPEGFFIKAREGSMGRGIFTSLEDKGVREALQNPERFIIQRRMPIEQEFRVHTLEGQPFASTHRWLPHKGLRRAWDRVMGGGGGAFVPATGQTRRELEDFVRQATAHLRTQGGKPLSEAGEAMHAAYDVAKLKGGAGYKLIEANPVPGTLMNPVIAQKLQRQVTGRWSKPVAALGAAGVAAPMVGATA